MPIYEYRCTSCGKEFEYQQRMADAAKTECEACKGVLERIISRTAFHLKGGGWYKDLYASTKPEGATGGEAAAPAATPSSDGAAAPAAAAPAAAAPAATSSTGSAGGGSSSGSSE